MASVTLRNVRKDFDGVEVIHGVTVDVADGEFVDREISLAVVDDMRVGRLGHGVHATSGDR